MAARRGAGARAKIAGKTAADAAGAGPWIVPKPRPGSGGGGLCAAPDRRSGRSSFDQRGADGRRDRSREALPADPREGLTTTPFGDWRTGARDGAVLPRAARASGGPACALRRRLFADFRGCRSLAAGDRGRPAALRGTSAWQVMRGHAETRWTVNERQFPRPGGLGGERHFVSRGREWTFISADGSGGGGGGGGGGGRPAGAMDGASLAEFP